MCATQIQRTDKKYNIVHIYYTVPQKAPTQTPKMSSRQELTYEMFKAFVCSRAYDIIGNGAYKTFLVKCRENNDTWALETHQHIIAVLEHIKSIVSTITQIRRYSASGLGMICKDVITNTNPPSHSGKVWNVCQISGQHTGECVEVMRSQHKTLRTIFVHAKYAPFLNLLWYVCKIEHVIRNFTRQWLQTIEAKERDNELSMSELCEMFSQEESTLKTYFDAFKYGSSFVYDSLSDYNTHLQNTTVL